MASNGATVSSLLRAADSAHTKQLQLQDDLAAYEWNNSEQSQDDYDKYKTYLEKRQDSTSDQSKVLTFQNKINSARTAFASNEIQRSAINVLEGTSSLSDKQSVVLGLYKDAVTNGDLNLAQNLRNTYDSIDVQIQKQAEADAAKMATYADKMSKAQVTSLQELGDSYLSGDDPTNPNLSNKQLGHALKEYGSDFYNEVGEVNGVQYNVWDKVYDNVSQAIQTYTDAANLAYASGSESRGDSLYQRALDLTNGDKKVEFGGLNVSLDDINNARDAARNNQNFFQVRKDADGNNTLVKNKVTNYVWARDTTGALRIVQTYNEVGNNYDSTTKDDKGKIKTFTDSQGQVRNDSVRERLKAAGYEVEGTDGSGLLRIRDTNSTGRANGDPNSSLGESYLVSLDANGNVRYVSEKGDGTGQKIFQINLADPNAPNFGASQEVNGNDETFFGNKDINGYGSPEGINYINKLLQPLQMQQNLPALPDNAQVKLFNGDFSQLYNGDPVTGVVHGAQIQRTEIASRLQAATDAVQQAANAAVLQNAGGAFSLQGGGPGGANINQMPVPAGAQLTVAKPTPQPKVVVAPVIKQPTLSVSKVNQPSLSNGVRSGSSGFNGFSLQGGSL